MTDIKLDKILRNINLDYCVLVDKDDKINLYTTKMNYARVEGGGYEWNYYEFAIITDTQDTPVGIILRMDTLDIQVYTLPEYRGKGYMTSALESRELYELWDVKQISIKSPDSNDPDLIGRFRSLFRSCWCNKITHYDDTIIGDMISFEQAYLDYLYCIDKQVNDNHETLKNLIYEMDDYYAPFEPYQLINHFNNTYGYNMEMEDNE